VLFDIVFDPRSEVSCNSGRKGIRCIIAVGFIDLINTTNYFIDDGLIMGW